MSDIMDDKAYIEELRARIALLKATLDEQYRITSAARRYAQNADYWQENYYKARALLIAAFEGTGHPEAAQVKAINEEYQEFLKNCPRIPQHA